MPTTTHVVPSQTTLASGEPPPLGGFTATDRSSIVQWLSAMLATPASVQPSATAEARQNLRETRLDIIGTDTTASAERK
jgi:hypothetical protein